MPLVQIPLMKGQGKSKVNANYLDLLPVNILPVAREVGKYAGYHRFYRGIEQQSTVDGVSRGSFYNVAQNAIYRVCGGKLYKGGNPINNVPNSDRVTMACSRVSQAVSTGGKLRLYRYDGTVKEFSNWTGDTPDTPSYNWGMVGDVTRVRGRYIFAQEGTDTFWISSLEDESKPDKIAPYYRAESQPDGMLAVREWQDYLICFGSSTIEYFRLTGNANQVYQSQPGYLTQIGIIGRYAVTSYMGTFAFITSPAKGRVQVALMGQASYQVISDHHIEKLLASYQASDLADTFIESVKFDEHDLLILHLPNETMLFDSHSKMWTQIKSSFGSGVHRAIDYQSDGNLITVGDKFSGLLGYLVDNSSSQYGEQSEILLYSPMMSMPEMSIDRLSIVSNIATNSKADAIAISVTQDGVIWSPETIIRNDEPLQWINSTILDLVGEVRGSIGFRLRITGANPTTIAGFEMEIY